MTVSYLLVSSAYRDRLLYPNPADFNIPFGTVNNIFNVFSSTNPISFSLPDYNFCFTNFLNDQNARQFDTKIISGTAIAPVVDENVNTELLGLVSVQGNLTLQQTSDVCYGILKGWLMVFTLNGNTVVRDIIDYDPSSRTVTLRNPLPNFDLSQGPLDVQIVNLSINDVQNNPEICKIVYSDQPCPVTIFVNGNFLERSSTVYFDYVVYLYDVTLNEIRIIQKFQKETQALILCEPFSSGWSVTDQYWIISRSQPMALGSLIPLFENGPYYNPSFFEEFSFVDKGSAYSLYDILSFTRDALDNNSLTRGMVTRIGLNGSLEEFSLIDIGRETYIPGQKVFLKKVVDGECYRTAIIIVGTTSLVFKGRIQSNPMYQPENWVGNYFMSVLASPQYTYDSSTNFLHVSPNATIPVRNTETTEINLLESQNKWGVTGIRRVVRLVQKDEVLFYVQNYTRETLRKFDILFTENETIDNLYYFRGIKNFVILQFSYEGVVPLNFTGTQITQSQMSCYELTVINLILPNQIINSSLGLLTSAYPYVFLELSNSTMPSGHNRSVLYSNNPYAVLASFVCSISDVNNPETTRFIKISSDGASQIMKFSPFDNLHVRVSLPNGETFRTEKNDTYVPCDPDVSLQISMVFELKLC